MAEPSNKTLICETLSGRDRAFDRLVNRHSPRVMSIARRFTRDDEAAADLAQEIWIECYRSLSTLSEPQKFRSWLNVIARRVGYRWQQSRQAYEEFVFQEGSRTARFSADADDGFMSLETRDRLQKALRVISETNRRITVLHYLEEFGLEDIARHLNLPLGTVKRRLHDARKQIREEIIMTEAPTQKMDGIRKIEFTTRWIGKTGQQNPGRLTQTLLSGQILKSIRHEAKPLDRIAREVGAAGPYVEDHLTQMKAGDLVLEEPSGHYRADCSIVVENEWQRIIGQIRKIGKCQAEIITDELPDIRQAFEACSFLKQGYVWDAMQWLIIPAFTLSIGVTRCKGGIYQDDPPPLKSDGARWQFLGFEGTRDSRWTFYDSTNSGPGCGFVDIHIALMKKAYTTSCFEMDGKLIMKALADGPATVGDLTKKTGLDSEDVKTRIAALCEYDYLLVKKELVHLNFPMLYETDDQILAPVINPVASRIVQACHRPGREDLMQLCRDMNIKYPEAATAIALSSVTGYCCEYLVKRGVLIRPPRTGSPTWGFCGWTGHCETTSFEPDGHSQEHSGVYSL